MIHKTTLLRCPPARAFELFTEHAGAWWPAGRRHTGDAASEIVLEASGRFYERGGDGREVELGVVRVFERDARLVLDWFPGTGPECPTRVEVRFEAEGEGTRVSITHGPGPCSEALFALRATAYQRSWELVVHAWGEAAGREEL